MRFTSTALIGPRGRTWVVALAALAATAGPAQFALAVADPVTETGIVAQVAQADGLTQTSADGPVTIKATWQGAEAGPTFQVVLDTHSVNLDAYDLAQLAVLRTDQGVEVAPSGWDADAGGHHREGVLSFPSVTADESPVIGPETRMIELVVRGVAGPPERVLHWML